MTNAHHVGEALAVRCQNGMRELKNQHRHVQLVQGRAKGAQVYPQKLCEAIVQGMKRQMESDEWNIVRVTVDSVQEKPPKHDEDGEEEEAKQWAWDDITGAKLDPREVRRERKKEIEYIRKHGVYRKVN